MNEAAKIRAKELEDSSEIDAVYEFIKPYLEEGDPYAFYIYASFSLPEWNESGEEFDLRYVKCLHLAAEGGVVEAEYQLSVLYLVGDIVSENQGVGKAYLDAALNKNYSLAKYSVSLRHFYGVDGYEKSKTKALLLMAEAVSENVEDAAEQLEMMLSSD